MVAVATTVASSSGGASSNRLRDQPASHRISVATGDTGMIPDRIAGERQVAVARTSVSTGGVRAHLAVHHHAGGSATAGGDAGTAVSVSRCDERRHCVVDICIKSGAGGAITVGVGAGEAGIVTNAAAAAQAPGASRKMISLVGGAAASGVSTSLAVVRRLALAALSVTPAPSRRASGSGNVSVAVAVQPASRRRRHMLLVDRQARVTVSAGSTDTGSGTSIIGGHFIIIWWKVQLAS